MPIERFIDDVADSILNNPSTALFEQSYNYVSTLHRQPERYSYQQIQPDINNLNSEIDGVVDTILDSNRLEGRPETEEMLLKGLSNHRVIQLTDHFQLDLLSGELISTLETRSPSRIQLLTAQFRYITEIAMSPGSIRPVPHESNKRNTDDRLAFRFNSATDNAIPLIALGGLRYIANPTELALREYVVRRVFWRTLTTLTGKALITAQLHPLERKAYLRGDKQNEVEIRKHETNLIFIYAAIGILGFMNYDPDTSFVASEILPMQVNLSSQDVNPKINELNLPFTIATTALLTHDRVVVMPKGRTLNPVLETVIDYTVQQRAKRTSN